ncbi:MAG: YceD family protein [Candidatus Hydrogenedens sp.]
MDILKIRIMDISDKGYLINEIINVAELQPIDIDPLPIETIHLCGIIKKTGKNFLFQGKISGYYNHTCDRCLDNMQYKLEKEMTWLFERGQMNIYLNPIEESNRNVENKHRKGKEEFDELAEKRVFQGDEIDLTPYIWEELVLDMPYKFLCSERCAGLCPICGTNLNHETCSCNINSEDEQTQLSNTKLSELLQGIKLNLKEE